MSSSKVASASSPSVTMARGFRPRCWSQCFSFTQVNRQLERSQGGLGIGLSLVQQLVELHGGSVEARSAGLQRGSTFIVRLPLIDGVEAPASSSLAAAAPTSGSLRVLVVDDNVDAAESLALLLQRRGHQTRIATSGPDGVDAALAFRPDVLFLDIGLPGLDGFEVATRLRPVLPDAFIAALTGWGSDADRRRTTAVGFDAHLTKPVEASAIADVLEAAQRRARRPA